MHKGTDGCLHGELLHTLHRGSGVGVGADVGWREVGANVTGAAVGCCVGGATVIGAFVGAADVGVDVKHSVYPSLHNVVLSTNSVQRPGTDW